MKQGELVSHLPQHSQKRGFLNAFRLALYAIIILSTLGAAMAHGSGSDAYVRVVSADPASRTYTFTCNTDPQTPYLRDFFVRPDNGNFSQDLPNEAESLDRPQGDDFTYTFQSDRFYHIGCIIVNESNFAQQFRGDMHIDLRPDPWNPNIVPVESSGKTSTLRCDYGPNPYAVSWEVIDARTGEHTMLGTGKTLTHTVPHHGLFDYICHVQDQVTGSTYDVPLPVEYFDEGDPYFPDRQGVPAGITNAWARESPNQTGACYAKVQDLPVTCTGSITSDTFNGCRSIACSQPGGTIQALACDKPGGSNPQYFEMYKQSSSGSAPRLCVGQTCLQHEGFARSANYPLCGANTTMPVCGNSVVESGETCDDGNTAGGDGCSSTCQTETLPNACYTGVQHIPATCTGGSITQDTFNGCRSITCAASGNSVKILACDKPGGSNPQYFEMYRQAVTGAPPKICIGTTCMQQEGFARSASYPICNGPVQDTAAPAISGGQPSGTLPAGTTSATLSATTNEAASCRYGSAPGTGYGSMIPFSSTGGTAHSVTVSGLQDGQSYAYYVKCQDSAGNANANDYQISFSVASGSAPACFTSVQHIPATCAGGSITQDTFNGCRTLQCSGGGNSIKVLACDKPSGTNAEYFEMYRQAVAGTPPSLCIGQTCMQHEGFRQSGHYPLCGANTTTPVCGNSVVESGETCDDGNTAGGDGCSSTCQAEATGGACHSSVEDIPATCTGGSITQDTFNGCRTVVCSNSAGSMQILACDKPSGSNPQYFEMYKQAHTGSGISKICLGGTCISDSGYARSASYPICSGSSQIAWIEPTENQADTSPTFFHLNVEVPVEEPKIASTTWEVWNQGMTERVWMASNTGSLRFHTHTPDGAFQGSRAGTGSLAHSTTYKARVRYHFSNGSIGPWSSWRTFTTSSSGSGGMNLAWTAAPGYRVERFATGFDLPTHIAFAPDGMYHHVPESQRPYFYVTELYGTIKVVTKDGSQSVYAQDLLNFDPFGSITGGGQMGLIGLYVDDATGDLIAGMTYVENEQVKNKVVRFFSTADGRSHTGTQTLISNLPSSPSHQVEQITKGPDGKLYVQLGDALNEHNAQDDSVLAGKIIRMNMDGSNVEVYAKGLRNPFGGDWRPGTNQLFVTDNSPNTNDRLLRIVQGGNYEWGPPSGSDYVAKAIWHLNVSPVDVEFNPGGKGFPSSLTGRMYVAVAGPIYAQGPVNGKEIIEFTLNGEGSITGARHFVRYTGTGYGTPIGLDFGPDGLYFTDIYGEPGFMGLGQTEGNVYRVVPGDPEPCTSCGGTFRAAVSVVPWYPKDTGSGIEYVFECKGLDGSGTYLIDWDFGDGRTVSNYGQDRIGPHQYPYGDREYTVTCTVKDQVTMQQRSASMVLNPDDFMGGGE